MLLAKVFFTFRTLCSGVSAEGVLLAVPLPTAAFSCQASFSSVSAGKSRSMIGPPRWWNALCACGRALVGVCLFCFPRGRQKRPWRSSARHSWSQPHLLPLCNTYLQPVWFEHPQALVVSAGPTCTRAPLQFIVCTYRMAFGIRCPWLIENYL